MQHLIYTVKAEGDFTDADIHIIRVALSMAMHRLQTDSGINFDSIDIEVEEEVVR